MKPLHPPESHHLAAAEGWIGLGVPQEGRAELDRIPARLRCHPEVLRVEYHLHEAEKNWELAAQTAQAICRKAPRTPFGWVHLAYALHELKRTREAYNTLLPVVTRFPDEHIIRYNLACYSCQLGHTAEARQWLRKAMALAGTDEIKKLAATDPDLQPLWAEIRQG